MRVYFAADFGRAAEVEALSQRCAKAVGVVVASRWHGAVVAEEAAASIGGPTDAEAAQRAARRNVSDLDTADVVVVLTTGSAARGGRHFETGYAWASGKRVVLVGPVEHAFHRLPGMRRSSLDDLATLLAELSSTIEATPARVDSFGAAARQCVRAQGFDVPPAPTLAVDERFRALWPRLLDEEVSELRTALADDDLVGVADALADVVYVALSAGATYGLPMDEVFSEVHRSNLSKVADGGEVVTREDGKILKPPTFSPPRLAEILQRHHADGS